MSSLLRKLLMQVEEKNLGIRIEMFWLGLKTSISPLILCHGVWKRTDKSHL